VLVDPEDYIYGREADFASPVVLESHKLVFFLVHGAGEVTWKQLFRRLMGYSDWQRNPEELEDGDGLRYLHHYNVSQATHILTHFTRAIMVRDPKERLLSAFLALSKNSDYVSRHCCQLPYGDPAKCTRKSKMFSGFLQQIDSCESPYWRPQGQRMNPKYYSQLDFVGHLDTAQNDARRLLETIGAWKLYGNGGWGSRGEECIFAMTNAELVQAAETKQAARRSYRGDREDQVERFYSCDYSNKYLKLKKKRLRAT
jgi:hypothetical protein